MGVHFWFVFALAFFIVVIQMKIYLASSWKNPLYATTAKLLKEFGHTLMDWQVNGFGWSQVSDTPLNELTPGEYRDVILKHRRAIEGFLNDFALMRAADCCVLLLPCGRSAHLEAGWFVGNGKPLHIHIPVFEQPELMYKFANSITFTIEELVTALDAR